MDVLPSAEFRKVYAKLTAPTVVTVNGHEIGTWVPAGQLPPVDVDVVMQRVGSSDTLAARLNPQRPFAEFRPVPKPGTVRNRGR